MLRFYKSVMFVGIFSCLCCWCLSSAFACELTVRTYPYPPFAMKDQHGQWRGIDIDYTKVLLDESNCRYTFVEIPWGRGIVLLREGKIDMMLNVTKTPRRAPFMHFVGPQRMETLLLVAKKDSLPMISHWSQLKTLEATFMRQRGTFIGERFEQLLTENPTLKNRLIYLANNVVNIDMIRKGRAVGFFSEQAILKHEYAKNPDYSILETHPLVINRAPVFYAFSKASMSAKQIQIIIEGYHRLEATNKLEAVEAQYDKY
ncbi:MAG: polar amino acid transport system substrate-binding protein [Phenylobacterium sp.]|jgi:polar amino acid transport system substrate-binding protein